MDIISRRQALRLFGSAVGGAAVIGTASGFGSPALAASPTVTATLDKLNYEFGELMTLVVEEDLVRPERRSIVVTDSTGALWTKVSDNGHTPVFTAKAGANRLGRNTVTVALKRQSDGLTVFASDTYALGEQWRPRFAGDRQDRVMLGMAVTDKSNSNLRWENAVNLLGTAAASLSVRRCFLPAWISKANIDKWANWAETNGVYPVISFKVPSNDWAGVPAGRYDADLDLLVRTLQARATAGRAPVCVAVHHEPAGDGDLAVWARMQEYLSNHFAPYSSVFCFTTISNGYDWGPFRGGTGEVARVYPRSLIDTLNRNKHILGCDTYDSADNTKLDYGHTTGPRSRSPASSHGRAPRACNASAR
jgi:hypothetical protein